MSKVEQSIGRYLAAANTLLATRAKSAGVPVKNVRVPQFPKGEYANRAIRYPIQARRDFDSFVWDHREALNALPEANEMLEIARAAGVDSSYLDIPSGHNLLISSVHELLRRHRRLLVPEAVVNRLVSEMALLFRAERLAYRGRFVLTDFAADGGALRL